MIIRGIDFARHNVVVGNTDAEAPRPGQAGPDALPQRGDLMARVIAVAGGEATLDITGLRVVVESHVALNIGDKLMVRVHAPQNGTQRLTIVGKDPEDSEGDASAPAAPDGEIDGLLRDLNLPTDDRTRQAARALVARDGTLEKPALKTLMAALKHLPPSTPRDAGAAALLQKNNVPVNQATMSIMAARAQPEAPPQLVERLQPLIPVLQQLAKQLPPRSPALAQIQDVLRVLQGIPLDESATNEKVVSALRDWLDKLQPKLPADAQGTAEGVKSPPAPPGGLGRPPQAQATPSAHAASPSPDAAGGLDAPETAPAGQGGQAAKQAGERADGVSASQRASIKVGITKGEPSLATTDLATQLEKLGKDLGSQHKEVGHLIREAVAELRFTQLANGPGPTSPTGQEYLVPLMLPQLSPDHPEGRIQVFQRAARKGEPIDPNNVRFVFVLETEHMKTVQADMSIKDGNVDLTIGVPDSADRELVASHLDELESAIASLGWPTGRFGARQARGLPPPVRQQEGISDVVRFDRRV